MMSNMYCAHCGEQNVMMFASRLGPLFTKENKPSVVSGDALYASVELSRGPDLVSFLCDSCHKWFAIFSIPAQTNNESDEK